MVMPGLVFQKILVTRIRTLGAGNGSRGQGGIVAMVHFQNRSSGRLGTFKQKVLCDGRKSLGKSRRNVRT